MLRPHLRGQKGLEFDDHYLNILTIAPLETVKGIQWALDKSSFSERKFRLYPTNYSSLGSGTLDLSTIDLALVCFDLGQPFPSELLSKLKSLPALCAFIHPTPQQLLSLGTFPNWSAMAWDGSAFEKIAQRLFEFSNSVKEVIELRHFVEGCQSWILRSEETPDFIEWSNPPEDFLSPRIYALDQGFGILTLGTEGSGTMIKVPIPKNGVRKEWGEFRFISGAWTFKSYSPEFPLEVRGRGEKLRPGDQISIGGWIFILKRSPKVDEVVKLAQNFHVFSDAHHSKKNLDSNATLAEICKDFLHSGYRGELRISAGLKSGSIYFEDTKIVHSRTGSVSGRKALLRMISWGEIKWKFYQGRMPVPDRRTLSLNFSEFSRLHQMWKQQWQQISNLMPPLQLKLGVSAPSFLKKKVWSNQEAQVLAAVCEFSLVRDVMNFCLLDDVHILDTLVQMRRIGLIEVAKK